MNEASFDDIARSDPVLKQKKKQQQKTKQPPPQKKTKQTKKTQNKTKTKPKTNMELGYSDGVLQVPEKSLCRSSGYLAQC